MQEGMARSVVGSVCVRLFFWHDARFCMTTVLSLRLAFSSLRADVNPDAYTETHGIYSSKIVAI